MILAASSPVLERLASSSSAEGGGTEDQNKGRAETNNQTECHNTGKMKAQRDQQSNMHKHDWSHTATALAVY